MTDVIERLWFAHLLLTVNPEETSSRWAIDEAGRLFTKLLADDLVFADDAREGLDLIEAARGGDAISRESLAHLIEAFRLQLDPRHPKPARPRGPRKPTLADALKQAAKANVPVSAAVIGADGITLRFGESEPTEASNPWLDDLKVTKQ